jgi:hypothetical protein
LPTTGYTPPCSSVACAGIFRKICPLPLLKGEVSANVVWGKYDKREKGAIHKVKERKIKDDRIGNYMQKEAK